MTAEGLGFVHRFQAPSAPEAPTLLLLHGTGGDESDLLPLGGLLAPDAGLLSPRGNVDEDGMARFFRRLAEGVFDTEDLVARTHELASFVEAAAERYGFGTDRLVAVGFSNGANIAAATLLLRPGLLRGAALFAPMVPLRPEPLPDLAGTVTFVSAGRADPIAGPRHAEELAALLHRAGAAVEVAWHAGGHQLGPEQARAARRWLDKLRAATAVDPLP